MSKRIKKACEFKAKEYCPKCDDCHQSKAFFDSALGKVLENARYGK